MSISILSLHLASIPFKAYFASSDIVGSSTVLKQTETPRVLDCVRTGGHDVRWENSGGHTQDGLECIERVDRKTGELRGSDLQGVGDAGEMGVFVINVKTEQGGSCDIKKGSRQSNRRLSDISKLEIKL